MLGDSIEIWKCRPAGCGAVRAFKGQRATGQGRIGIGS